MAVEVRFGSIAPGCKNEIEALHAETKLDKVWDGNAPGLPGAHCRGYGPSPGQWAPGKRMAKKVGLFNKGVALPPMTPGEWAGCSGYRGIPVASAAARAMQERRLTAEGLSWDTPSSSKARAVSDVN